MSSYVMSDVHGHLEEFNKMLELIEYNPEEDNLYLIGDYVDWGDKSIELIIRLIEMENTGDKLQCLMGNHDKMMLDIVKVLDYKDTEAEALVKLLPNREYYNWEMNGGYTTLLGYLKLGILDRKRVIRWLKGLRYFIDDLEVGERKFYLCHSSPYMDGMEIEDVLWNRMRETGVSNKFIEKYPNTTLISGHTIVKKFNSIDEETMKCKIYKSESSPYINIDCGAKVIGYKDYGRLGCIRLEDLVEFYI